MDDFEAAWVREGIPQVVLELTEEGAARLRELTRDNIGRRLALVVDDQVVALPLIRGEVTAGELDLMSMGSEAEAQSFAERINAVLRGAGTEQ